MSKSSNRVICKHPFFSIQNNIEKPYTPCCWARTSHSSTPSPKDALPFEYFDSDFFRRFRKEMLDGERTDFLYDYCKDCWYQEDNLGHSHREEPDVDLLEKFNQDGSLSNSEGRFIKLALNIFGNYCNLECYECIPRYSSSRDVALRKLKSNWEGVDRFFSIPGNGDLKKVNTDQFNRIIKNIKENSSKIETVEFVGGEPALMKSHFEILDALIESGDSKEIQLSYVSNMTLLNLDIMKRYFDNFKHTHIQWSVDGIGKRNYWLRYPTDWESTLKNVYSVRKHPKVYITSTITPTCLNIFYIKELINFLIIEDLYSGINNFVVDPDFLRIKHLPDNIKNLIDIKDISLIHHNELISDRDEKQWQKALKYFDELDQSRGTDWKSTFPEIYNLTISK